MGREEEAVGCVCCPGQTTPYGRSVRRYWSLHALGLVPRFSVFAEKIDWYENSRALFLASVERKHVVRKAINRKMPIESPITQSCLYKILWHSTRVCQQNRCSRPVNSSGGAPFVVIEGLRCEINAGSAWRGYSIKRNHILTSKPWTSVARRILPQFGSPVASSSPRTKPFACEFD